MITEDEQAARSERALRAAVAAAGDLGLDAGQATIVYDVFSVVVDLAPAPVVARVPVVTPPGSGPEQRERFQRTELAVAAWLHGRGEPTVLPSPLVPAEPVTRDGFAMTFWQRIDDTLPTDYDVVGRMPDVARLHAVLRDYPGELRFFPGVEGYMEASFDSVDGREDLLPAADLARARAEWAALSPLLASEDAFGEAFPGVTVQPTHGDAPFFNIIETVDTTYYSDFEHVGVAPVEWDLAHTGAEALAAYAAAAGPLGLRPVEPVVLAAMERVRDLQMVACLAMAPALPLLVDGLAGQVDAWRVSEPWRL
ncbi:aminoglycoside phosphotransferase/kinase family protein [Actinokineospora pegani]|uniref:aminoglycoside phosphotransferase family protein n=1 Tax=Actinokineospora pegani TaxID=2654637 RepID=UPI0012E9BA29|nr:aminoglycoside phosphotransferase family protein [Actinokineospora pegani]